MCVREREHRSLMMVFVPVYLRVGWITFCRRKRCSRANAAELCRRLDCCHTHTRAHSTQPPTCSEYHYKSFAPLFLAFHVYKGYEGLGHMSRSTTHPPSLLFLMGRLWKNKTQGSVCCPSFPFSPLFVFSPRCTKASDETNLCRSSANHSSASPGKRSRAQQHYLHTKVQTSTP